VQRAKCCFMFHMLDPPDHRDGNILLPLCHVDYRR
jgi:hypothetical protein